MLRTFQKKSNMQIRPIEKSDVPQVKTLIEDAKIGFIDFDYNRLAFAPGYVAEENGKVFGYCGGTIGAYGFLGPLVVLPDMADKYAGMQLVAKMMRFFRLSGINNILAISNNKKMIRACVHLGWTERNRNSSCLFFTLPEKGRNNENIPKA